MEVERNLQDAMHVTRNVMLDPRLVPGGGAAGACIITVSCLNGSHLHTHTRTHTL